MPEQLSRKQVELILRRTAELERRDDDALDTITAEDLERVASELGLSQDALRQAIAESRAGVLGPEQERTLLDRLFGGRIIDARRFVPGDVETARAAVEHFLREQGFEIKRNLGDVKVWEPARDWWTRVRAAFRAGAYRLPRDVEVAVRIAATPGGPHPVLVSLRVDATRARGSRVGGAAASVVVGAAIAVGGAIMLPMPIELATAAAGALAGVGGGLASRGAYRSERERLSIALERFLDFLEHEEASRSPAPRDPVTRLIDFLSRDWWK
jgi:hypothetical protein